MSARVAVPLGILAAAFALPIAFAPAIFFAWALTFAGLFLLSREPPWRRAARIAMASLAAFLALGALGAGAVVGWRGERLLAGPEVPESGLWGSVLMVSGILAIGVLLLLAPDDRTRRVARWAAASSVLLFVALGLVVAGERVAGLIGLFGAITLALVAGALVWAFVSTRSTPA